MREYFEGGRNDVLREMFNFRDTAPKAVHIKLKNILRVINQVSLTMRKIIEKLLHNASSAKNRAIYAIQRVFEGKQLLPGV